MKHIRHCRSWFACLLLVVGGLSAQSRLQAAMPQSVVQAPTAAGVNTWVKQQVDKLAAADPSQWKAGRDELIDQASHQGLSATFLDVYAQSINDNLKALAASKDARVRLNAAIVAARVASKAGNARLAEVTLLLLKDPSDAVVLWGMQSAKYVVPALLMVGNTKDADAIAKATIEATKNHMTPATIEEAYRVLLLDPMRPGTSPVNYLSAIDDKVLAAYLPNPMALYDYRIKLYDDVTAPTQPLADSWASTFLTETKVWNAQTPAQRGQTLSLTMALLKGANKQNATLPSPEMLDLMKRTGQALEVAAKKVNKPALLAACHAVALISANTAPDEITTMITNLDAALAASGLPMPASPPGQ